MGPCRRRFSRPSGCSFSRGRVNPQGDPEVFVQPERKTKMIDHSSSFRVPPNLYQHFCRAPSLDPHIAAMHKQWGSVSTSTVVDINGSSRDSLRLSWQPRGLNGMQLFSPDTFWTDRQKSPICNDVVEAQGSTLRSLLHPISRDVAPPFPCIESDPVWGR